MRITYIGGTETVTGSKFLVETANTKVLVDCGLYQGYKWLRERNWQPLPLDIDKLDAVLLTHAHLDHSGYIPVLYKHGFRGPVFTHGATTALCRILLADAGSIQEADARFYTKHKIGKHDHPEPLYDQQTAEASMALFQSLEFNEEAEIGDIRFHLHPVGHILGAASLILQAEGKRVGFSGDVGRYDDILMRPPKPLPSLDLLMMEATYGDRLHEKEDPRVHLAEIVNRVAREGSVLLVPSFAVGRAQALQHLLAELMENGRIPKIPIYLDSPMAIEVSDIYYAFSDQHKLSRAECNRMCSTITYLHSVDDSKGIEGQHNPHIIIAGSGMATGGRILHHFKRLLQEPKTTVLFTGYQAGGTRGAKMLQGVDKVKIHGEWVDVKATIEVISSLSGHGDYLDLTRWLEQSQLTKSTRIRLIHGEPEALEGLRVHLSEQTPFKVDVAGYWEIFRL